jgi:hypothetical protein
LTHVKEFSVSPWIQEIETSFQNGRIPLVLELSGWSLRKIAQGIGYRAFGAQKQRTVGNGTEKVETPSFYPWR